MEPDAREERRQLDVEPPAEPARELRESLVDPLDQVAQHGSRLLGSPRRTDRYAADDQCANR